MLNNKMKLVWKLLSVSIIINGSNAFGMENPNQDPTKDQDKNISQSIQQDQNHNNDGVSSVSGSNRLDENNASAIAQFSLLCSMLLQGTSSFVVQQPSQPCTVTASEAQEFACARVFFGLLPTLIPDYDDRDPKWQFFAKAIHKYFPTDAEYSVLNQILFKLIQMDKEGQLAKTLDIAIFRDLFLIRYDGGDQVGAWELLIERFPGISGIQTIVADNENIGGKCWTMFNDPSSIIRFRDEMQAKTQILFEILWMMFRLSPDSFSVSHLAALGFVKSGQSSLEAEQCFEKSEEQKLAKDIANGWVPMTLNYYHKDLERLVHENFGNCEPKEKLAICLILRRCAVVARLFSKQRKIESLLQTAVLYSIEHNCSICTAISNPLLFDDIQRSCRGDVCYIVCKIHETPSIKQTALVTNLFKLAEGNSSLPPEAQIILGVFFGSLKEEENMGKK